MQQQLTGSGGCCCILQAPQPLQHVLQSYLQTISCLSILKIIYRYLQPSGLPHSCLAYDTCTSWAYRLLLCFCTVSSAAAHLQPHPVLVACTSLCPETSAMFLHHEFHSSIPSAPHNTCSSAQQLHADYCYACTTVSSIAAAKDFAEVQKHTMRTHTPPRPPSLYHKYTHVLQLRAVCLNVMGNSQCCKCKKKWQHHTQQMDIGNQLRTAMKKSSKPAQASQAQCCFAGVGIRVV